MQMKFFAVLSIFVLALAVPSFAKSLRLGKFDIARLFDEF